MGAILLGDCIPAPAVRMQGMRLPRFSVRRRAAATLIFSAIAYGCVGLATALKHARMSKAADQYMAGELSREVRKYLGDEADSLEMKVHSMPESGSADPGWEGGG